MPERKLTPIKFLEKDRHGNQYWLFQCACGNQIKARRSHVRSGATKSCGCLSKDNHSQTIFNFVGKKFGRLTVVEYLYATPKNTAPGHFEYHYRCKCNCGQDVRILRSNLLSKNSQSCGCLARERASKRARRHGMFGTQFYTIYRQLRSRCTQPSHPSYKWYGGKGIKAEWPTFESFYEDMYESYAEHVRLHGKENTTIDRINPNKNYNKDNCRWATYALQSRNRGTNHLITFRGETKCITDWARDLGVNSGRLYKRLKVYGWTVERALTTTGRLRRNTNGNNKRTSSAPLN